MPTERQKGDEDAKKKQIKKANDIDAIVVAIRFQNTDETANLPPSA